MSSEISQNMAGRKHLQPIVPDGYYHVYNRAVNENILFYSEYDYHIFIMKFKKYILTYADILAYCLLPNHFHLLIKTIDYYNEDLFCKFISGQFRKLFISHTMGINHRVPREGNLFCRPFKRIKIENERYLRYLLFYIHFNPQKHKYIEDFRNHKFSSYNVFFNVKKTVLDRTFIEYLFNDDKSEFLDYHNHYHDELKYEKIILEEN
jgi:REP element-mobilizing transposase RayT